MVRRYIRHFIVIVVAVGVLGAVIAGADYWVHTYKALKRSNPPTPWDVVKSVPQTVHFGFHSIRYRLDPKFRNERQRIKCMNNMNTFVKRLIRYSDQHDGRLPPTPGDAWVKDSEQTLGGYPSQVYKCPVDKYSQITSYLLTSEAAGKRWEDLPKGTIVLKENEHRHGGIANAWAIPYDLVKVKEEDEDK